MESSRDRFSSEFSDRLGRRRVGGIVLKCGFPFAKRIVRAVKSQIRFTQVVPRERSSCVRNEPSLQAHLA